MSARLRSVAASISAGLGIGGPCKSTSSSAGVFIPSIAALLLLQTMPQPAASGDVSLAPGAIKNKAATDDKQGVTRRTRSLTAPVPRPVSQCGPTRSA
jgi:hypothetical protein